MTTHPSILTEKIKEHARQLGFVRVGVARAEKLSPEGERLTDWLQRGYQATMGWMERNAEARTDPRAVLPGARSVVCVAMNYYTPAAHTSDADRGKISRYAWGDDYHIVVTERLERLRDFILRECPTAAAKLYVDTGPVMDKAWAVRAGIGWLGKHTNVITKEYGSWVFLGEIILDQDLVEDAPFEDHCGTCRACLDACPTGAIVEEYVVDSNKCISYLTIEHRGPLPEGLTPQFQNWVYGCDICQDVCPWNRFQQESHEQAFASRPENLAPVLQDLAAIDQEEFSRRFRRSPVKRTKREGLARNARAILDAAG